MHTASDAGRILGRIRTSKKSESSRRNGKKGGRPKKKDGVAKKKQGRVLC